MHTGRACSQSAGRGWWSCRCPTAPRSGPHQTPQAASGAPAHRIPTGRCPPPTQQQKAAPQGITLGRYHVCVCFRAHVCVFPSARVCVCVRASQALSFTDGCLFSPCERPPCPFHLLSLQSRPPPARDDPRPVTGRLRVPAVYHLSAPTPPRSPSLLARAGLITRRSTVGRGAHSEAWSRATQACSVISFSAWATQACSVISFRNEETERTATDKQTQANRHMDT